MNPMDEELGALFDAYDPMLDERDFTATLEVRLDAMERRARRVRWAGGIAATGILIALALSSSTQLLNLFARMNGFASELNDTLVSTAGQWTLYGVTATALLIGWRRIRMKLRL
jgi:hypothetical protein